MEPGSVFSWHNFIFSISANNSTISLHWIRLIKRTGYSDCGYIDKKGDSLSNSPLSNDDLHGPKGIASGSASYKFEQFQQCQVVAVGYSYDPHCLQRVPVFLTECFESTSSANRLSPGTSTGEFKSRSRSRSFILFAIRFRDLSPKSKTTESASTSTCSSIIESNILEPFIVVPLRKISLNVRAKFNALTLRKQLSFCSNFKLLFLDNENSTFRLYSGKDFHCEDFKIDGVAENVQLLDVVQLADRTSLVALVKNEENCFSFLFTLKASKIFNVSSTPLNSQFEMKTVPLEIFFAKEFSQILKALTIVSISRSRHLVSDDKTFCSSVVMITTTGYVLLFEGGVLSTCVWLLDPSLEGLGWTDTDWENIKILNFDSSCGKRTAVCGLSNCYLIDWSQEKMIKSWSSIFTVLSCDISQCGISALVLIDLSRSTNSSVEKVQESSITVIDVDGESECLQENDSDDESGKDEDLLDDDHGQVVTSKDKMKIASQPQCAINALLLQKKKCQSALKDAELTLQREIAFVTETWERLSQLQLEDRSLGLRNSVRDPSLVTIIEGSLPTRYKKDETIIGPAGSTLKRGRKYLEVSELWSKTIHTCVVVGVEMKNVSSRTIKKINLKLLVTKGGQPVVFESTSKLMCNRSEDAIPGQELDMPVQLPVRKKLRISESHVTSIIPEARCDAVLKPGCSAIVTCQADIAKTFGSQDMELAVFVEFVDSLVSRVNTDDKGGRNMAVTFTELEEACGIINISSTDLINEKYVFGKSHGSDGVDTEEFTYQDLLALDSVQIRMQLKIHSVVSSVSSLQEQLRAVPSVRHVPWAGQYVVLTNQQLKFCRVNIFQQTSRFSGRMEVLAGSEYQSLIFIKFLYSLVPEDLVFTPLNANTRNLRKDTQGITEVVIDKINDAIKELGEKLNAETEVTSPLEFTVIDDSASEDPFGSPKFYSSKVSKYRPRSQAADSSGLKEDKLMMSTPSSSGLGRGTTGAGEQLEETEKVKMARKRLRERWGEGEDQEEERMMLK